MSKSLSRLQKWSEKLRVFQKNWLVEPEVYPILGALSLGLGLGCYFGINKLFFDPSVVYKRQLRVEGLEAQLEARKNLIGHKTGLAKHAQHWPAIVGFSRQETNPVRKSWSPGYLEYQRKQIEACEKTTP
uniref:Uncharacterized protein n=1 Tax=Timspurckia oligopyrenoides TaxID=708627 RepID=A0A7S0ZIH4_9RHOD|mmetsp:Transcript_6615/g.11809  ORF Transcript_6615/g.11809 Transcript_6615/m.11809 type:complete len:130 (+) Transcript_6615:483-872(+)